MKYRLVMLTHGDAHLLAGALDNVARYVEPQPSEVVVHIDGTEATEYVQELLKQSAFGNSLVLQPQAAAGFCESTARAWRAAAAPGPDWVVWFEHDFRLLRPINFALLADVMKSVPRLVQMALYRTPVSPEEHAAGGYMRLPQRNGAFQPQQTLGHSWFEHTLFWTTNVSLFRRHFAAQHQWPRGPQCEGHFGFQLHSERPGSSFGIWGDGSPDTEHVSTRTGFGY